MSLTSDHHKMNYYADFYSQVFPMIVKVDIPMSQGIPTHYALNMGDGKYSKLAYYISKSHKEYIPIRVSYIPKKDVVSIKPYFPYEDIKTTNMGIVNEWWVTRIKKYTHKNFHRSIINIKSKSRKRKTTEITTDVIKTYTKKQKVI